MAYFPQFKKLFTNEITYCFNTPEEKKLFEIIYDFTPSKYSIVGMHLDYLKPAKSIARKKPYVIYIGRIDAGKGILELISLFEEWLDYSQADLELLLIGSGKLPKLENSKIFQLGYIDEEEKAGYLEGAEFLINPSQVESFSIVIMEAWLKEKAVLVNAKSEIMKNHCIRSNGGLYYYDKLSFFRTMDYLLENPLKRKIMGQNGKRYVELNYNKERIQNKLKNLIYL
jgi:glycosyltransferase involved in cell wall biosynthesis